jgi:hypothetical protein
MGLKEIRIHCRKCISRVVIVALSAQPPGVNKLCVCVQYRGSCRQATVLSGIRITIQRLEALREVALQF